MGAPAIQFSIPHRLVAAMPDQARPDKLDFQTLLLAATGWAWMSGAGLAAQAFPDLTVHLDAGAVAFGADVTATPAADIALDPDPVLPRTAIIGADQLYLVSHARDGAGTMTLTFSTDPLDQGWRVGEKIKLASSTKALNGIFTIASINSGARQITVPLAGAVIPTTGDSGVCTHVGAWHGNPTATPDRPPCPPIPPMGFIPMWAITVPAAATTIEGDSLVDKRCPRIGSVPTVINAMEFPYLCANDRATYDGDKVEWVMRDAQRLAKKALFPGGAGYLMTNGGTNKMLAPDFSGKTGILTMEGDGPGQSAFVYTAAFPLNTSVDPSLKTAIGDPGGRVSSFAIEPTSSSQDAGSLHWTGIDIEGPTPVNFWYDGTIDPVTGMFVGDRTAGWAIRMNKRVLVSNCHITGFYAGLVYRRDCDHNWAINVEVDTCWYGCYSSATTPTTSNPLGEGDHVHESVFLSGCAHSNWASDASATIFDARIASGHWGTSAFGFYREPGPVGHQILPFVVVGDAGNATWARDATHGEITLDTKTPKASSPFPGISIGPAYGFQVGDPIDLSALAAAEGVTFDDGNGSNVGIVTAVTAPGVLTISMGSYDATSTGARGAHARTGSAIATTKVTAAGRTVAHNTNLDNWLNQIYITDTSFEGCTVSNIFDQTFASIVTNPYGQWQFHGLEPVGRNNGTAHGWAPYPVVGASRKWLSSASGTTTELTPGTGDVYEVTLTVAAGHGLLAGNIIFYDASPDQAAPTAATLATKIGTRTASKQITLTTRFGSGTDVGLCAGMILAGAGVVKGTQVLSCSASGLVLTLDTDITSPAGTTFTFLDDRPSQLGWNNNGSRARGKWELTAVTATTLVYHQLYKSANAKNVYTGTAANPYVVTGGGVGMMASIVTGGIAKAMNWTVNTQHEGQSGQGNPEILWLVQTIRDCEITMSDGVAPRIQTLRGFNGFGSGGQGDFDGGDPCNSGLQVGHSRFRICHASEALFPMALCEAAAKDDAALARGGFIVGFSIYAALQYDYVTLLEKGPTKPKPVDYGGVVSSAGFAQNDILAALTAADIAAGGLPGFVKKATGAYPETVVARARGASTGPFFGLYATSSRVEIGTSEVPSAAAVEVELKVIADDAVLTTGDGKLVFCIPASLSGRHLIEANAFVTTVSSSGAPTISLFSGESGMPGNNADMLSTSITIDASEFTSYTAATPSVPGTSGHTLVTKGDLISVNCDVAGTGAQGLGIILRFQ